jgi:glycosyltransferase involved in cell wall biosynthesis
MTRVDISRGKRAARKSKAEFLHFLSIAQGSLSELDSQLEIAHMLGYIDKEKRKETFDELTDVFKMLSGLIRSFTSSASNMLEVFPLGFFIILTYLETQPKFLLVGDGPMKEQIVQRVNDLHLTDNFIFIERVPYEEVPKYVNAFDVCVILKKKDIPGSPLKLWEYMACGKPVIATNTEDFKALEKYNAGILVDPEKPEEVADAIISLLKNKELMEEMGKNGRKYVVENRSWEAVARRVEKVMKEAIK